MPELTPYERTKEWRAKHRDRLSEQQKRYWIKHKKRIIEYQKVYRNKKKDENITNTEES